MTPLMNREAFRVWFDLRDATRFLIRHPTFTFAVVTILALSIASTTTAFAVTYSLVLRPLPFPTRSRLVELRSRTGTAALAESRTFARSVLDDVTSSARSFDRVGDYIRVRATLTGWGDAELLNGLAVTPDVFTCYGVSPLWGRSINAADTRSDVPAVVLSYSLWQRDFGATPWESLDSKLVTLSLQQSTLMVSNADPSKTYRIVGIMPQQEVFPVVADFFVSLDNTFGRPTMMIDPRAAPTTGAIALLKPGMSLSVANADLAIVAHNLAAQYPETDKNRNIFVSPLRTSTSETYGSALFLLLAAVHCVLLIALISVTGLFVVGRRRRVQELAIRQSLGAGPRDVIIQAVAETGLAALLGGVAGVLIATLAVRLVARLGPTTVRGLDLVGINWVVLAYATGVSAMAGIAVGYASAFAVTRTTTASMLRSPEPRFAVLTGARPITLRGAVVVSQLALSLPLLLALLLLLTSLANLAKSDVGYDGAHLVTLSTKLSHLTCATPNACKVSIGDLVDRLGRVPGVAAAAMTSTRPLSQATLAPLGVYTSGDTSQQTEMWTTFEMVTPLYFSVTGVPIRLGRGFTNDDTGTSPRVALVNHMFAMKAFGGNAIGKAVTLEKIGLVKGVIQIVGETGDVREFSLSGDPLPEIYLPVAQVRGVQRTVFLVRAVGQPESVASLVRQEMNRFDPSAPVIELRSFPEIRAQELASPLFVTAILAWFGGLAVLLMMVGSYSVAAQAVSERLQEISIRMAIGAMRRDIVLMILREASGSVILGVVLGLAVAAVGSRWLEHMTFGISVYDPKAVLSVSGVAAGVSLLAHYVPIRRAAATDLLRTLRCG